MTKAPSTTTKKAPAAAPAPKKLVIKLGVCKEAGLLGTIGIKSIEYDCERTSLLFGRHYKVCVYVNDKTKTVVPLLYLDNSTYGSVVEVRPM